MKTKLFALASWAGFLLSAVTEYGFDLDFPLTPPLWLAIGICVMFTATGYTQFTASIKTNTINGVTSNWVGNGTYVVGSNTFRDVLQIINGGVLSNGHGVIGYEVSASNNLAVIAGIGSVWSNSSQVDVGFLGRGNSLVISNGGAVVSLAGFVGNGNLSSNNAVLVTGQLSVWTNRFDLFVGADGRKSSLVISNGGKVYVGRNGYVGSGTGLGTGSSNTVVVASGDSVWKMANRLSIGDQGHSNLVQITSGSVVASNAIISSLGSNNVIRVDSGSLFITNAVGDGTLVISRAGGKGSLILNFAFATVTVDSLIATNGTNSVVTFNSGTLSSGATFVTNAQQFVVGSGTNPATYHLLGGIHSFNSGLRVRSNAFVTGCGTITGTTVVDTNGTVKADCGGTLTFTGSVTNNGTMWEFNSTLEAYGTVVNNGTINLECGSTNFHGAFINNGTVTNLITSTAIGNGLAQPDGSYINAGHIADQLAMTNVSISKCNKIDIVDDIDLSFSTTFGPTFGNLSLYARTLNLTNGILFGFGYLNLNIQTVNLNGTVTESNGVLLTRLTSTATNINVLSDAASFQQAMDIASPKDPVTVQIFPGQYHDTQTISKQVTLVSTGGASTIQGNVVGDLPVSLSSCTGVVKFAGGTLYVTNSAGTARLLVLAGNFTLSNATLTVDKLLLPFGPCATFIFNSGTLHAQGTAITNGQQFVVGDGAGAATFHLLGGVHSFNDGLRIRTNATLSGCGTINGVVVIDAGGTVLVDCGRLTLTGSVTNNGTMRAINGSLLEAFGTVVNNGTIDILDGSTAFHSTVINNGVILAPFRVVGIGQESNDIRVTWTTSTGMTNELQATAGEADGSYNTNNFAAIFTVTNTVGTVTNYLDVGAATNVPARYYRIRVVP